MTDVTSVEIKDKFAARSERDTSTLSSQQRNLWETVVYDDDDGSPNRVLLVAADYALVDSSLKNLTGLGEIVGVANSGIDYNMCYFRDDNEEVAIGYAYICGLFVCTLLPHNIIIM